MLAVGRCGRQLDRVVVAAAHDLDLGALAGDRLDPRGDGVLGHEDPRAEAQQPSHPRDGAAVVAVGRRDERRVALRGGDVEQLVEVAAGSSRPARRLSARHTAHDAPRILNDGSPKRSTSIFAASPSRPSRSAAAGASASGLTR